MSELLEERKLLYILVEYERRRQIEEWGYNHDDRRSPLEWIGLMTKFLGKAASGNKVTFGGALIQLAALCIAALEWIERRER